MIIFYVDLCVVLKIIKDELENEKEENRKLHQVITELQNRPETAALVTATMATTELRPGSADSRKSSKLSGWFKKYFL